MQVSALSAQLGLRLELVDWYRDATSSPYGHLLFDLSPRTGDRLRYCTNTLSISSKVLIPDRLEQSKVSDDDHAKSCYSPSVPIIFPQMQSLFLQSFPKEFILFLCECLKNLLKRNLQSIKRNYTANFHSKIPLLSLKRTTWEQIRDILVSEKDLQHIKVSTPPVIKHLF